MGNSWSRRRHDERQTTPMTTLSRDLLECPVCLEIPDGDADNKNNIIIYQCENGHPICATCSKGMKLCPQCRGSMMDLQVRNRAMERLIEGIALECKYKKNGCKAMLPRKGLRAHEDECKFGPSKRFHICERLFRTHCEFSSRRGDQLLRHFLEEHRDVGRTYPMVVFPGLEGQVNSCLASCLSYMRKGWTFGMFVGVEVTLEEGSPQKFLFCFHWLNKNKRDFSVSCWYFGQEEASIAGMAVSVTLELSVAGKATKKARWAWTGKPTHYLKIGFWNPYRHPSFKISMADLLAVAGKGEEEDEKLNCSIQFSKC